MLLADEIARDFNEGKIGSVVLVYTKFVSMLTQSPVYENLLPLEREVTLPSTVEAEESPEELLGRIIPCYLGGIISSAVAEAVASESGSRRNAMSAANKNAEEMIVGLNLSYNRARQAMITQEITEIVSGAEAL
jgi:F-type H+-transporting ATPase subunit gamma